MLLIVTVACLAGWHHLQVGRTVMTEGRRWGACTCVRVRCFQDGISRRGCLCLCFSLVLGARSDGLEGMLFCVPVRRLG